MKPKIRITWLRGIDKPHLRLTTKFGMAKAATIERLFQDLLSYANLTFDERLDGYRRYVRLSCGCCDDLVIDPLPKELIEDLWTEILQP